MAVVVVVSVSAPVAGVVVMPIPVAGDIVVAGGMVVVAGDMVVAGGIVVAGDIAGLGVVVVIVVGCTSVLCSQPEKSAAVARIQIYFFIVWVGSPVGLNLNRARHRVRPYLTKCCIAIYEEVAPGYAPQRA